MTGALVAGAFVATLTGLMVVALGAAAAALGRTGAASAAFEATGQRVADFVVDLVAGAGFFCRTTFWAGAIPVFGIATDVGAGV